MDHEEGILFRIVLPWSLERPEKQIYPQNEILEDFKRLIIFCLKYQLCLVCLTLDSLGETTEILAGRYAPT